MKPTNHEHQDTNFKSVSKPILFTALALAGFITSCHAENTLIKGITADQSTAAAFRADQFRELLSQSNADETKFSPVEDKTIVDPSTIISSTASIMEEIIAQDKEITDAKIVYHGTLFYIEKSAEEAMAADRQITESHLPNDISPLQLDKTTEDVISEDNQIIDSTPPAAQPLDFSKIDRAPVNLQSKRIIGMN